jgi:hypothetical protein
MSAQSARIEAGQVHLPREATWLEDFRTELLQFLHGKYDDQVDSLSQFLNWVGPLSNRNSETSDAKQPYAHSCSRLTPDPGNAAAQNHGK